MARTLFLAVIGFALGNPAHAGPVRESRSYAAIAYHAASGGVGWAADRATSREARLEALRQCAHPKCEVVGTVRGGCAALARSERKFKLQKGVTRAEAETKALRTCGQGCEIAAWTCTR